MLGIDKSIEGYRLGILLSLFNLRKFKKSGVVWIGYHDVVPNSIHYFDPKKYGASLDFDVDIEIVMLYPSMPMIADVNGDGKWEIAVVSNKKQRLYDKNFNLIWEVINVGADMVKDINGDGMLELVGSGYDGSYWSKLVVLDSNGKKILDKKFVSGGNKAPTHAWDVNGDGKIELVFGADDNHWRVTDIHGNILVDVLFNGKIKGFHSMCDVDGDGEMEVHFLTYLLDWYFIKWDGTQVWVDTGAFEDITWGTIDDIDNDGVYEIFTAKYNVGYRTIACRDQNGNLEFKVALGSGAGAPSYTSGVHDIDNDGEKEIIFGTAESTYCLTPSGTTKWRNATSIYQWCMSPTITDFNGDGELEVGHGGKYGVMILNSSGEIIWKLHTSTFAVGNWCLDIADLGNGKRMIVYSNEGWLRLYK